MSLWHSNVVLHPKNSRRLFSLVYHAMLGCRNRINGIIQGCSQYCQRLTLSGVSTQPAVLLRYHLYDSTPARKLRLTTTYQIDGHDETFKDIGCIPQAKVLVFESSWRAILRQRLADKTRFCIFMVGTQHYLCFSNVAVVMIYM